MDAVSESSNAGLCFARDSARPAPHNLYTTGDHGRHLAARWDLTHGPLLLLGADGSPLPLPAGLTWIHLVNPDTQVAVGA